MSNIDATANDNLVVADMDIDEETKEDEPAEIWANAKVDTHTPVINQQLSPTMSPAVQSHRNNHHNNRNSHRNYPSKKPRKPFEPKFVQIPNAPNISGANETNRESEDMILDSDVDDDESSQSVLEAQKRKKLPIWIREGLERIEREKKQEALRIQKEKEMQEDEASRKKLMEEALKELEREKLAKSKYVSWSASFIIDRDWRFPF